jgi:hypothetical protein
MGRGYNRSSLSDPSPPPRGDSPSAIERKVPIAERPVPEPRPALRLRRRRDHSRRARVLGRAQSLQAGKPPTAPDHERDLPGGTFTRISKGGGTRTHFDGPTAPGGDRRAQQVPRARPGHPSRPAPDAGPAHTMSLANSLRPAGGKRSVRRAGFRAVGQVEPRKSADAVQSTRQVRRRKPKAERPTATIDGCGTSGQAGRRPVVGLLPSLNPNLTPQGIKTAHKFFT